jgi:uncharacterized membrane protein
MDLSPLHLHLMLNHIPVLGTIAAALLLAIGLARRSREVTQLGLGFAVVVALSSVPVFLTGDPAEDALRDFDPSVDRRLIHAHEEQAEVGYIAVLATGALALVALWRSRRVAEVRRTLPAAVCVALLISFGLFAAAALKGGEIRHTELHSPSAALSPPAGD